MIHFVFANVNPEFIGCGRYSTVAEKGYRPLISAIFNKDEVEKAASILAPRSAKDLGAKDAIYEKKDTDKSYAGDSMDLAYLLTLISRCRTLRLKSAGDIWCTGKISVKDDIHPTLQQVEERGFSVKLSAFLSDDNADRLFIVPASNLQDKLEDLCKRHNTTIATVDEFRNLSERKIAESRTILTVGADELDLYRLLSVVFDVEPNPYKGLEVFTEEDADRFFGREALAEEIWNSYQKLQASTPEGQPSIRLLAILGPSGSGKSSVARAGFIPKLRSHIPASDVVVFTPGGNPLRTLANRLAHLVTHETNEAKNQEFEALLRQETPAGLSLIAEKLSDTHLVILVDQFEEIYTRQVDDAERRNFIRNLIVVAEDRSVNVAVVIVLRSDFLGRTQRYSELNTVISEPENHILVPGMRVPELRTAIQEPAKRAGYPFAVELVDCLISETEGREGALPLLEFALTRLWEGIRHGVKPDKSFERIGGVGGALAGEAQSIYEQLSASDRLIARRAFLAMITLGEGIRDTRRRIRVSEIVAHQESLQHVHNILAQFSQPGIRLITLSSDEQGEELAEVTHEALFEHWDALKAWLDESREDLRFHRRLADTSQNWDHQKRPHGSLWRSPDLDLLRNFHERHKHDMTAVQMDFFNASASRQQWRQRFKWGIIIALMALTVGSGIWAWQANWAKMQAEINETKSINQRSRELWRQDDQLQALLKGIGAGKLLRDRNIADIALREKIFSNLREIVYGINEVNRLEASTPYTQNVLDVTFSPDGKYLVSASQDQTVKLWEVATGREIKTPWRHKEIVASVAFSPDGKTLATGSWHETIKIWDVATGKEVDTLRHESDKSVNIIWNIIWRMVFSPDGKYLASASFEGTIKLWDLKTTTLLYTLKHHDEPVFDLAFSPNGEYLASGSLDGTVKVWRVGDGSLVQDFFGHKPFEVLAIAFHPNSKQIASSGMDTTIRIWNVSEHLSAKDPVLILPTEHNLIFGVAFNPDGTLLASAGTDLVVKVWNVANGKNIQTFRRHKMVVWKARFSPAGSLLASNGTDGTLRLWNTRDNKLWEVNNAQQAEHLKTRSPDTELETVLIEDAKPVLSVAVSPDGNWLASGAEDKDTITIWNVVEKKVSHTLSGHTASITTIAFHPQNSAQLVSGSADGTVKLWDVKRDTEIRSFSGHTELVTDLAFSPDGKRLVSGSEDRTAKIWRVDDGRLLTLLPEQQGTITSLAFSSKGILATASGREENATITLWDVDGKDAKALQLFVGHIGSVDSLIFSPDGTRLISGSEDKTIKVWNVVDGREERTLRGHTGSVKSLAVSFDGVLLISGSDDTTTRLWNVADGKEIKTISGHADTVESIAFAPDETFFASASWDGTIKIWNTDWRKRELDDLLVDGCQWLSNYLAYNHTLSDDEREVCKDILAQELNR